MEKGESGIWKAEYGRWKIDPPAGGGRWGFDGSDLREWLRRSV